MNKLLSLLSAAALAVVATQSSMVSAKVTNCGTFPAPLKNKACSIPRVATYVGNASGAGPGSTWKYSTNLTISQQVPGAVRAAATLLDQFGQRVTDATRRPCKEAVDNSVGNGPAEQTCRVIQKVAQVQLLAAHL